VHDALPVPGLAVADRAEDVVSHPPALEQIHRDVDLRGEGARPVVTDDAAFEVVVELKLAAGHRVLDRRPHAATVREEPVDLLRLGAAVATMTAM
jgi:hypothetical protein